MLQLIIYLEIILFLAAANALIDTWGMGLVFDPRDVFHTQPYRLYYLAYPFNLVLGVMLYSLGRVQARFVWTRSLVRAHDILGVAIVLGVLFQLGTYSFFDYWAYDLDRRFELAEIAVGFWAILFGATTIAVAGFVAARYAEMRRGLLSQALPYEGAAALLLLLAGYMVVFLPVKGEILYPILFNCLLLLVIGGLILAGYFRGEKTLMNIMLTFLGVAAIARYIEFGFTLQDRVLFFLVAGIALLGGGLLVEVGRRWIFRRMRCQADLGRL